LNGAERVVRDAHVLRMFLAGVPLREIANHPKVQLSKRGVELAVRRQLAADAPHRRVLSETASTIHILRLEALLKAALPKALAGDLEAAEHCRRVLAEEARYYGLHDGGVEVEAQPVRVLRSFDGTPLPPPKGPA
jgi:hypothetical protein